MEKKGNEKGFFNQLRRLMLYLSGKYDRLQKSEIILGEDKGLPIYFYKNPKFNWMQMREIRLGLEKGLDVSYYAKSHFKVEQMEEIRLGLEKGLDVSFYNKSDFDWMQMREVRLGLEKGLDVSYYAKSHFKVEQMEEIRFGLERGIDVSNYNNPEYDQRQMREIRLGLEKELDISFYDNSNLDWKQMREIRLGMEQGVNIHQYLKENRFEDMKENREQQLKEKFIENETFYTMEQPVQMNKEEVKEEIEEDGIEDKTNVEEIKQENIIQDKLTLTKFDVNVIFPEINMGATDRTIKNALVKRYKDIEQAEKQFDIYTKRIKKLITNGYVFVENGKYKLTPKAIEESKSIDKAFEFTSFDSNRVFGYILRAGGALTLKELREEIYGEYKDETYAKSQYEYIKNRLEKNVDSGYITKNEDNSYSITTFGYGKAKEVNIGEQEIKEDELEVESEMEV
ncbi:hypothetical protein [Tissierella praeacuta]|uniref:hypothetical protein n=1 Tax=Tissierella praeacuta TaxID=43131 RepID=UPI0028B00195|nr:hypothetical protein [Tissierella praeacuta]